MEGYLDDDDAMSKVSRGFSQRSDGVFIGAIGALDGWLVMILKPSYHRDGILNPSSFFLRKGFYALNIQVIVDDKKRVLWISYSTRGPSHDSSAFSLLIEKSMELYNKRLFIIGDSAYSLRSFLITPYDMVYRGTKEDDFNFFHSSARIKVVCAFGEIDLRWGIFWSRLSYLLNNSYLIIEGAIRLQNFLVDLRESKKNNDSNDKAIFIQDCVDSGSFPLQVGNDSNRIRGRVFKSESQIRSNGLLMRKYLCDLLYNCGKHRLQRAEWYEDNHTHVHRID